MDRMTETAPDVSVVIPAYRAEKFIARAIQSVLDQPGVEPEIIVVVDGVVDRTADIARGFPKTQVVIHEVNRGAPASRNRGLALARSRYVMFLDADDWVEGPLLRGIVETLQASDSDLVIGPCADASAETKPRLRAAPRTENGRSLLIDWLSGRFIPPCALAWRREYVFALGGWDEALRRNQDGDLVLRAALNGARLASSSLGRGVYWQHESLSRITNRVNQEDLASTIVVLRKVVDALGPDLTSDATLRAVVSSNSHTIERVAAFYDLKALTEELAEFRKNLGFPRYDGSVAHVVGSRLLGLPLKEKLSRWLAAQKGHRLFEIMIARIIAGIRG